MDAQLNDLIRLKQPPSAPVERWQMLPTRERLSRSTAIPNSPLRARNQNSANIVVKKTPESSKFAVRYRRSPKVPSKTPKHHKTPGGKTPHSRRRTPPKNKTPSRTVHTPSGCRFIPNRLVTYLFINLATWII